MLYQQECGHQVPECVDEAEHEMVAGLDSHKESSAGHLFVLAQVTDDHNYARHKLKESYRHICEEDIPGPGLVGELQDHKREVGVRHRVQESCNRRVRHELLAFALGLIFRHFIFGLLFVVFGHY